jgi:hypothetical protein
MTRPDHQALPYAEKTDPEYAKRAAKEMTISTPTPGVDLLSGPCPQCRGEMRVLLPADVVKGARGIDWFRPRPAPAATEAEPVPIICECGLDHPGRPEGEDGCGAYWSLILTPAP